MTPGSLTATVCAGALLFSAAGATAQNLSVSKYGNSHIVKTVPNASATRLDAKAEMTFEPVPEPTTLEVMTLGAMAFLLCCRVKNRTEALTAGIFRFYPLAGGIAAQVNKSPSL